MIAASKNIRKKQAPTSSSSAAINSSKNNKKKRKTASVESNVTAAHRPKKNSKTANNVEESPRAIDIVCGRGCGLFAFAPGNIAYRRLVDLSRWRYEEAEKHRKVEISREIVQVVKAQPGNPRFLMENSTTKAWEELSYKKSVAKTSQTFRDLLGSKTRISKATSDDETEVDDESGVPMMNNRMPTTSSLLPTVTKRNPYPQDTAARDMDEMRLLLQEITASAESEVTPTSRPKKNSQTAYTVGEPPRAIDIVCGRGCGRFASAPGNVAYHRLVGLSRWRYEEAEKHRKVETSRAIVQVFKAQPGTPRFLMENPTTRAWEELSYEKSVAKTSQTFRDLTRAIKATSDDETEVDDESGVPMMNNRIPTTSSFLPLATKRRFTTGHSPPTTAQTTISKTRSDDESEVDGDAGVPVMNYRMPTTSSLLPTVTKRRFTTGRPPPTTAKTRISKATSDNESEVKDKSRVPMINYRIPTTSSFFPSAKKRRFTTGHPSPTTAAWKPCPQDTAAHDMDEMRLLLQEIHSEELRREKYKYVPETPPAKKKKK
jgi:hypothetical protein